MLRGFVAHRRISHRGYCLCCGAVARVEQPRVWMATLCGGGVAAGEGGAGVEVADVGAGEISEIAVMDETMTEGEGDVFIQTIFHNIKIDIFLSKNLF